MDVSLETSGRVTFEPAQQGNLREAVTAPCEVKPDPDAAGEVSTTVLARIVRWHVTQGSIVRAGDPVVTLDAREVAEQRASLARARIDEAEWLARVEEETRLLPQGATSGRSVREARAALARARSAIETARRVLSSAQADGTGPAGTFVLRAPVGGTIVRREGIVGGIVQPGTTLASVVDMTRARLAAHLPEDAVDVSEGAPALVTLRGSHGVLRARLVWRSPTLDPATRTRLVFLAPERTDALTLEQTGIARIERQRGPVTVLVPEAAIHREGMQTVAFVRIAPGRYAVRRVTVGSEWAGVMEILSGLRAGEPVVVQGAFLVASEWLRVRGQGEGS